MMNGRELDIAAHYPPSASLDASAAMRLHSAPLNKCFQNMESSNNCAYFERRPRGPSYESSLSKTSIIDDSDEEIIRARHENPSKVIEWDLLLVAIDIAFSDQSKKEAEEKRKAIILKSKLEGSSSSCVQSHPAPVSSIDRHYSNNPSSPMAVSSPKRHSPSPQSFLKRSKTFIHSDNSHRVSPHPAWNYSSCKSEPASEANYDSGFSIGIKGPAPPRFQSEGRRGPRGQSRFKGVCITRAGKWRAVIYIGRKQKYLGVFDSELQAAQAYNESALEFFGAGAKLNYLQPSETRQLMEARQVEV